MINWSDLRREVRAGVAVVALVAGIGSAYWALDARYARAADVEQKFRALSDQIQQSHVETQVLILEGRRDSLVRERVQLETKGHLTMEEKQRLELLRDEISQVTKRIDRLTSEDAATVPRGK